MSGYRKQERYEVESWDPVHEAWVLETSRTSRAVAEEDVQDFRTVGKRARIVGDHED
jgi:hypothetical protein